MLTAFIFIFVIEGYTLFGILVRPIGWPCSEYLMLLNQSLFLFILGDELN